jgi:hypothetical protein
MASHRNIITRWAGLDQFWTDWQWYRSFFNITIFRYFTLVFAIFPILIKTLGQIPKELTLTINLKTFIINLELPFNWYCLWFSAFFYVIAYALYLIFCPSFIKKYPSYSEYKAHLHSPRWIAWEMKEIVKDENEKEKLYDRLKTKSYLTELNSNNIKVNDLPKVDVKEKQTELTFMYKETLYKFAMPILVNEDEDEKNTLIAEREVFWEIFGRFSSSKQNIRFYVRLSLFLSTFFFVIVLIQNIVTALFYVINDFIKFFEGI